MKRLIFSTIFAFVLAVSAVSPVLAQLSAEATFGYGIPSQQGSNGIWGGGLGVKYFISPGTAVGLRVRTYVETIRETGTNLNGRLTAASIPIMGTFEYHLTITTLHPYVGLEAGIIRTALEAKLSYNGREVYNDIIGETNLGIAPKAGIAYDITQGMTLMAEALYNVGFGKNQAGTTQFSLQNSSRFLAVNAGVVFTFGNRF
jgi:opacity protein-like surface antigen